MRSCVAFVRARNRHVVRRADPRTFALLSRIADTLGVPASDFLDRNNLRSIEATLQSTLDTVELLDAFKRITNPEARRNCIEFVRVAAFPAEREKALSQG